MSKIQKCRLEAYWASTEVSTCPKSQNVVWKPTGLAKRFLHVQNSKMSFGNLLGEQRGFYMSNIPQCHLETYWANKDVFTCPKSKNVVWKPTGLTKRTFLFYGPMAPGAHRAHIFLINVFIYFVIFLINCIAYRIAY